MKSFIKNLKGTLKMALVSYPVVLLLGGTAGIVGLLTDGLIIKAGKINEEVRNTEIVQELVRKEEENLNNPDMPNVERAERKAYLESEEFIEDIIKRNPELKEFSDKKQAAFNESICSIIFALPVSVGLTSAMFFYSSVLSEDFTSPCKKLIKSAKADFKEAKKIKELNQKKKEEDELLKEEKEYNEEIL